MRKIAISLVLALSSISIEANADALGLFVGGGIWNHDASGTFGDIDDASIDVESSLNYDTENDTYMWAAFEHFVPLVPNIRIETSSIGHGGSVAGSVNFKGFPVSGDSSISLDSTDTILYYRLLDNWVNFDFGLNLRKLEGDFTVGTQTAPISETIPLLYVAAQFDLPFSGFSVGGDINVISYSGSSYQDVRLRAIYEMGVIGFEAGLRSTTIELDDVDNIDADLSFEGMMLGVFLHF